MGFVGSRQVNKGLTTCLLLYHEILYEENQSDVKVLWITYVVKNNTSDQNIHLVFFSDPYTYQKAKKDELCYFLCIIKRFLYLMLLPDFDSCLGLYSLLIHIGVHCN